MNGIKYNVKGSNVVHRIVSDKWEDIFNELYDNKLIDNEYVSDNYLVETDGGYYEINMTEEDYEEVIRYYSDIENIITEE